MLSTLYNDGVKVGVLEIVITRELFKQIHLPRMSNQRDVRGTANTHIPGWT